LPRFAANLTLLFTELDFEERFAAARLAGFRGVECQFPYAWAPQTLRSLLDEQGLSQVLFNLPAGDWAAGERGIACLPERVAEFRSGVAEAIHYARILDCPRLNCLAGLRPGGLSERKAWQTLTDNLYWAAGQCRAAGITLCVEAINTRVDMPGFLLDSSAKAAALLKSVAAPNLKFQYDIYHMQIMEGDLIRTLERLLPHIDHIQFADNPGRAEPGTGEINFSRLFNALDRMGYDGWVSAEYHPRTSTSQSLDWLRHFC
jgi:hydroxypyruvate isomerase